MSHQCPPVPRPTLRFTAPTLLRAPMLALAMTSAAAVPWCIAAVVEARSRAQATYPAGACREVVVRAAAPAVPAAPAAAPEAPRAPAVERLDDDLFLVRTAALGALVAREDAVLGDRARFLRRGRQERGVRVLAARPGGLFHSLGLEPGDLVQRVDDVSLTPRSVLALAELSPRTRALRVELLRRGEPVTLRWVLVP